MGIARIMGSTAARILGSAHCSPRRASKEPNGRHPAPCICTKAPRSDQPLRRSLQSPYVQNTKGLILRIRSSLKKHAVEFVQQDSHINIKRNKSLPNSEHCPFSNSELFRPHGTPLSYSLQRRNTGKKNCTLHGLNDRTGWTTSIVSLPPVCRLLDRSPSMVSRGLPGRVNRSALQRRYCMHLWRSILERNLTLIMLGGLSCLTQGSHTQTKAVLCIKAARST